MEGVRGVRPERESEEEQDGKKGVRKQCCIFRLFSALPPSLLHFPPHVAALSLEFIYKT